MTLNHIHMFLKINQVNPQCSELAYSVVLTKNSYIWTGISWTKSSYLGLSAYPEKFFHWKQLKFINQPKLSKNSNKSNNLMFVLVDENNKCNLSPFRVDESYTVLGIVPSNSIVFFHAATKKNINNILRTLFWNCVLNIYCYSGPIISSHFLWSVNEVVTMLQMIDLLSSSPPGPPL